MKRKTLTRRVRGLFGFGRKFDAVPLLLQGGFDRLFYERQAGASFASNEDAAVHYHQHGWRLGLDPSPLFSTTTYLRDYPDVAAAQSDPFLHFIQYGEIERRLVVPSAHQVADVAFHLGNQHDEGLAGTIPEEVTLTYSDDVFDSSPHAHDIAILRSEFDVDFYRQQLPHIDFEAVDPVVHYAAVGWKLGIDPSPNFSTSQYLKVNADVRAVGVNPYVHFLTRGAAEGRQAARSSFGEKRAIVADGRREWADYRDVSTRQAQTKEVRKPRLSEVDFIYSLTGSDLIGKLKSVRLPADADGPLVSVIIPCMNEADVTAECLFSLFMHEATVRLEIIVVDNGSEEPFFKQIAEHPDIRVLRFEKNIGFGPACNAGAKLATGEFLFFLNNDAQVKPDAITQMSVDLAVNPDAGIVGPKLLNFDGHLQEAGALLNADGTGALIGFGYDPLTPRFNYRRKVEHVSGAAVMLRSSVFAELGGFDDCYAPAYCEDADLSLKARAAGYSVVYLPDAQVAHHLSKSTSKNDERRDYKARLVARNRAKLVATWSSSLQKFDIRTIAFYLPQYHPVPENDLWWGKGFTEWRNAGKARQNYVGHRQPRFPADLGYYDLRAAEVMEQQAALARRYGVTGFCYYYYWFGGRRILEMPLERLLKTGKPSLPFCLCWANENWTRRWDGQDQDILLKQEYRDKDAVAFAEDVGRFFESPQYITIDGKPIILIYRALEMPNPTRFFETCRNVWRRMGYQDVVIAMVESFELSAAPQDPKQFGADVTVEFPAHGMVHDPAMQVRKVNAAWTGAVHDYRNLAAAFMNRVEPGFHRMRSVLVGWDTTPRHPDRSLVLEHATPGAFQAWLEWTYRRTREQNYGDERLVFVNAWNEWCEGSYLEPDLDYGHAYLQAVKNAQEAVVRGVRSFEVL